MQWRIFFQHKSIMKNIPKAPKLGRKIGLIAPKVELVIACEGRNTEPDYLNECVEFYSAGLVRLKILESGATPRVLVRAAIAERNRLIALYRKSKDSFDCCFKVWVLFDRDEHPFVDESIQEAKESGVEVGFSDPCFELWPLLHIEDYGSQDGRHDLQRRLRRAMPNYDHEHEARIDFQFISTRVDVAIERANILNAARNDEGCPNGCPSTSVGRLIQKIIENGKIANTRRPTS